MQAMIALTQTLEEENGRPKKTCAELSMQNEFLNCKDERHAASESEQDFGKS